MIRAATVLWVVLAAIVGIGLFQLKHEVQALDEELVRLNRKIAVEHQTIHVLKAEWSYINQPQRLEVLAQRHLSLMPMKPQQITRIADLPRRPAEDADMAASPGPNPAVPLAAGPTASSATSPHAILASQPNRGVAPAAAARPVQPARPPNPAPAARIVADRQMAPVAGPR